MYPYPRTSLSTRKPLGDGRKLEDPEKEGNASASCDWAAITCMVGRTMLSHALDENTECVGICPTAKRKQTLGLCLSSATHAKSPTQPFNSLGTPCDSTALTLIISMTERRTTYGSPSLLSVLEALPFWRTTYGPCRKERSVRQVNLAALCTDTL